MTDYSQFGPSLFTIDDSVHEQTLIPILKDMSDDNLNKLWEKTVDMFINNKFKYYEKTYDKSSPEQKQKKIESLRKKAGTKSVSYIMTNLPIPPPADIYATKLLIVECLVTPNYYGWILPTKEGDWVSEHNTATGVRTGIAQIIKTGIEQIVKGRKEVEKKKKTPSDRSTKINKIIEHNINLNYI